MTTNLLLALFLGLGVVLLVPLVLLWRFWRAAEADLREALRLLDRAAKRADHERTCPASAPRYGACNCWIREAERAGRP